MNKHHKNNGLINKFKNGFDKMLNPLIILAVIVFLMKKCSLLSKLYHVYLSLVNDQVVISKVISTL